MESIQIGNPRGYTSDMRRRDAGITLVEVAAAITILGIVVALLVPAWHHGSRLDQVLACQGNLRALHQAQSKAPPPGARDLGSAYWVRLTKTSPPLVAAEALRCPLLRLPQAPECHYFGPPSDPAKVDGADPIGCDLPINHSDDGAQGGNILLKSGEVLTDHIGVWLGATRGGKCRP
jgi:hypothetical protein